MTGLLKRMVTGELCVLQKSKLLQEQVSEDYSDLDCRGLCQAFVFSDCCLLFSFDLMIGFYFIFFLIFLEKSIIVQSLIVKVGKFRSLTRRVNSHAGLDSTG